MISCGECLRYVDDDCSATDVSRVSENPAIFFVSIGTRECTSTGHRLGLFLALVNVWASCVGQHRGESLLHVTARVHSQIYHWG